MERNELVLLRLSNQYLLRTGERMEVLRAMNGFQAQFLSNALYAMRLRSTAYDTAHAADGLVKGWTLRGTMHIFAEADLPLFLHSGCRYRSRDWTVPSFWNQRPASIFFRPDCRCTCARANDARGPESPLPRCRNDAGGGGQRIPSLGRRHTRALRARLSLRHGQRGKGVPPLSGIHTDGGAGRTAGTDAGISRIMARLPSGTQPIISVPRRRRSKSGWPGFL